MTIEIPAQHNHEDDRPADAVSGQIAPGTAGDDEVLWVDPRELVIGDNVRTDVTLDKGFVADIKDRGVRQIIPVHRDEFGRLVLQTGQKRVLAAIEAGLDRVRVIVEQQPLTDERDQKIARVLDQLGENEHRRGISDADETRATQQLLDLGLTAGQISRRRHIGTKRVRSAAAVAQSQVAMDAVAEGRLDLAQAAVVAEFADDDTAVDRLTTAAHKRPEQFDHIAQQLRDDRDEARLREELTATLTEQGVKVIDRPDTLFSSRIRRLSELRATPDTKPGTELTSDEHASCPGHAAFLEYRGSWRTLPERIVPVWMCTDFPAHGHAERYTALGTATNGKIAGPMTEEQKAERRQVIANNKAWDSATKVRRDWLRKFFARKAAPAEGARWIAQMLAHGSHDVRRAMESDHQVAIELLGLKQRDRGYARSETHAIAKEAAKASPSRATTLAVAILVGALENGTSRHTWRSPTPDQIAYFRQLQAWGYPLSDVEMLLISPETADEPNPAETATEDDEMAELDPHEEPADADPRPDEAGSIADPTEAGEIESVIDEGDQDLAA